MKGNLTAQPLAELIREISSKALSGTLRVEHERAQAAVYFDSGQVIYAAANLKSLRLRDYVIKHGKASEIDLVQVASNLSDDALAAKLVSSGTLKQRDVNALMAVLVRDVLRVALLWTQGSWDFNEKARLASTVRVPVDPASLLREAAQRLPADFVSERFRNATETIGRGANISRTSNFLPAESFLLSRLDKPMKLGELIAESGLPQLDAHRVIYGLALAGLIEREYWRNAFRSDQSKAAKERAGNTAPFNEPERSDNWLAASVENEELDEFLARQRKATNHYEVIGATPGANPNEIKNAYYAMARRYHPDRFHLKSGTRLHSEISSVFARITQAYDILADPQARATYDLALDRAKKIAESKLQKETHDDEFDEEAAASGQSRAEQCFREGSAALEHGRLESAVKYLATAVRLMPQDARYRAYYGKALAADDNTRRLAENEIQTAVKLEPNNLLFRTMLAELYIDLKFYRRAETEIDRVLASDPKNGLANLLLRKLQKSRKVS